MARKMRAVKLTVPGDIYSAEVQEVSIPELKPGEVLVKVESATILHIDLLRLVEILGHEGSGTVIESGDGELGASLIGKRVNVFHYKGVWAEYLVCPANICVPLLDFVTFDQGANFINPLLVLEFQEILITGGHRACAQTAANSALGKMFVRLCRNDGIPLINIVRSERSVEALRNIGAENIINSSDPDFEERYRDLCGRLNVTVAFDAVAGDMTDKLRRGIASRGVVHIFGRLSNVTPKAGLPPADVLYCPTWIAGKSTEEREAIYQTIQQGLSSTFQTEIAGHYTMGQIREALRSYIPNMSAGKVLIHPNQK